MTFDLKIILSKIKLTVQLTVVLLLLVSQNGCVDAQIVPTQNISADTTSKHQAGSIEQITVFKAHMELLLHDHRRAAISYRLLWTRYANLEGILDRIDILSPFGQVLAQVRLGADRSAHIRTFDGREHQAPNFAQLSRDLRYSTIPLDLLAYWILGASHPDYSSREDFVAEFGGKQARRIWQQGWVINFVSADEQERVLSLNANYTDDKQGQFIDLEVGAINWLTHPIDVVAELRNE